MHKHKFTRYPVISLSAEYLAMGYLLRRNILTYKAPPNNEGYDLLCIHPDPKKKSRQIKVQVKSRLATDSDMGFPVKGHSIHSFDYLIAVFLNVGYFFGKARRYPTETGAKPPSIYVFPRSFIVRHHESSSSWEKVKTRGISIDRYLNEAGIEQIARALKIPYPRKH